MSGVKGTSPFCDGFFFKKIEAYLLEITPEQILIKASDTKGFFYALQSIRQLLPAAIESEQRSPECRLESSGNDGSG